VTVPRNDPTDTGGLFIGRRPGTGPVRYRPREDLRDSRSRIRDRVHRVAGADRGPGALDRPALRDGAAIKRFREYYRQFEELAPEQVSRAA